MPGLVEIGSVVLEKKIFLNFVNVFSLFRNYLPLEKGGALHLNKLESPLPNDALCQVWLKLALWFWRWRWKCEKFTTTTRMTTTTTDNWQILIRKAHLSLFQKNHSHQPFLLKVDEKLFYEYYKSVPLYQQLYSLALGEEHLTSQAGWVSKTKLRV